MRTSLIGLLMSVWLTSAAVVAAQGFNDPTAWTPLVKGLGPSVELSPTHAILTFPSTSQATTEVSFVAGVQTACQISGDFDVSVDYDLLTWPLLNGVRTGLWAVDLVYAGRISFSTRDGGWGESYYSNLPGGPFPIPTTDLQGTLRLARSGDIMTAFYLDHAGPWVAIHSAAVSAADVFLGMFAWSDNVAFAHQNIQMAFSNLTVLAGEVPCFTPPVLAVAVDIRPGETPNRVNPRSNASLPVAILGTETFAVDAVHVETVRFGATGTEASPTQVSLKDVNGDGRPDLLMSFATPATGLHCASTFAILRGTLASGQAIEGVDTIQVIGCR